MLSQQHQSGNAPATDHVFLIGFMGCGKTTLGRKLAAKLGYSFVDLDDMLEKHVGMTIAGYFKQHGEARFRELESAILKKTVYPQKAVISTGGGLPCFFDHMEWMNSNGRTLYIKLSPRTLADRLEHGKAERPLLRDKHGETLVAFIEEKLAERELYYNKATCIADGLNLNAERAEQILKQEANW